MIRQPGEKFEKFRERIKEEAGRIKEHLKGRVIKEAEGVKIRGRRRTHRTGLIFEKATEKQSHLRQLRAKRKIKNKMAYQSRRINRLRRA